MTHPLLPVDWSEAVEAISPEHEAELGEWRDNSLAFFMMCVLEERELTDDDLYKELLQMEPLDYDEFWLNGSRFFL